MRQIKFRVWDIDTKDYRYFDILNMSQEDFNHFSALILFTNFILEQFTGLYDKDGKEIYEGDIVENINMTNKKHKNAVVEWVGHRYILRCLCGVVFNHGFENISINEIKVIGNIHEEAK